MNSLRVKMKNLQISYLLFCFVFFCLGCKGQKPFGENQLIKQATIPIPDVKGRIDHLDINLKGKIQSLLPVIDPVFGLSRNR